MSHGAATTALPEPLLAEFSRYIAEYLGLNFPPERWPDLWRDISPACTELGHSSAEVCIRSLLGSVPTRQQAEILASHLTIGETYFFREPAGFEALETEVLPDLLRQGAGSGPDAGLRIWSAGCASGEEPYSVAILLDRKFPELLRRPMTILATDINPRALQKAERAIYTEWSFRSTPSWVKELYFRPRPGGQYELLPTIRRLVTFAYLNLAQDNYPAVLTNTNAMDLILCRNVLMYFTPAVGSRVLQKLRLALTDGGWLSVSPCDVDQVRRNAFAPGPRSGITFHKKAAPPQPLAPEPVPAARLTSTSRSAPTRHPGRRSRPAEPSRRKYTRAPAPDLFAQATEMHAAGRYAAAAELLGTWLTAHPQDTKAMELLARACANHGRLAEALEWCRKAVQLDRLDPGLHLLQATVLQEQGQLEAATASLKRVLYLRPEHLLAHFVLANIHHQTGHFAEARRHFKRALELLAVFPPEAVVPESEGITAGHLRAAIESTLSTEPRT